jgi:hypothetical protein
MSLVESSEDWLITSSNNALAVRTNKGLINQNAKRHSGAATTILRQQAERRCWACYLSLGADVPS